MTPTEIITVVLAAVGLALNLGILAYGYGRVVEKLDNLARALEHKDSELKDVHREMDDLRQRSEINLNRIIQLEGKH